MDTSPTSSEQQPAEVIEYRLEAGRSVKRTGADTFQTADGVLMLKVLEP
ncbi:hypothetical protein [Variovorax sp. Sphag1AA]|nr:hypothetical protein [Variovorax sp. Sphag1AA]MBB3176846.1 hypothetical protein [Variovorax sp. Sphag1AA]